MIHLASRALSNRWSKLTFTLLCLAAVLAFVMKPNEKRGRVVVTETDVEILDEVRFVGDTLSTPSLRTLDAIARTLEGNPSIELVEVQHSTEARARVIVDYLVGQGVEPERLVTGTIDRNYAAFLILERASDLEE